MKNKIEVILALRSQVLASDLARLEMEGWDADLSDQNIILFKKEVF